MCRSHSWLLVSWCLTSGLNLFASAAPPSPPPASAIARANDIRSLVGERDFWIERCARNGLIPDSTIGSKSRPLEAICGYLRRTRFPPVKSSKDETFIDRILRSGQLEKTKEEDSLEDERSQSKREGDIIGRLLNKDRFRETLGKDGPQPKTWNEQAVWSPVPVEEVPIAVDDSVDRRSGGSWKDRSGDQEAPSSDLERFFQSKRSEARMTRQKSVNGGPGTSHPRWAVYFIG